VLAVTAFELYVNCIVTKILTTYISERDFYSAGVMVGSVATLIKKQTVYIFGNEM